VIRYRSLEIENYKSIKKAFIDFIPGVYSVIGETVNGQYSSNGSGKSSILQALTLVLFNKDFQGAPLDSISNRYSNDPFKITLVMDVEKAGIASTYKIVNDRASKKLMVHRDGKLSSSATAKSLKIIQDILGMSEATFKFTHYITTNSILDLTTNLSNATLFNEVLQVTDLKNIGTDLLEVQKQYIEKEAALEKALGDLLYTKKVLETTSQYDIEDLSNELEAKQSELVELEGLFKTHITPLNQKIKTLDTQIAEALSDRSHKEKTLKSGSCALCGTKLLDELTVTNLQVSLEQLEETLNDLAKQKEPLEAKLQELTFSYQATKGSLQASITKLQQDLEVGQQLQAIHKEAINNAKYSPKALKDTENELKYISACIGAIKEMREAIKSGKIYEDVMNEFFKLVNFNIQKYKRVINFDTFDVEATAFKSGMVAVIRYDGEEIPVESLSNGEKARLSLLLLSALLESMSQVTNSESNFLAIDEATSSFDKTGIEELAALFEHLKQLEQSVFIITHGTELQNVNFDGQLKVRKENNVATATLTRF